MSQTPYPEPPPATNHLYRRPNPDMSDEELEVWAEYFVDAVLSNPSTPER